MRIKLPTRFARDRQDQGSLSVGTGDPSKGGYFWTELTEAEAAEYISDAAFYAGGNVDDCRGLVASAKATLRAFKDAKETAQEARTAEKQFARG